VAASLKSAHNNSFGSGFAAKRQTRSTTMKSLALIACLFVTPASSMFQLPQGNLDVPELRKINQVTLSPSYDCRPPGDTKQGYANTALFLTSYSRQRNSPELLFTGACKSPDYFRSSTAGDDVDVITHYGEVPLEQLAADDVFGPSYTRNSMAEFRQLIKVQPGHTYGVLINKSHARGFYFFKVVNYVPNQKLDLEYVVMDYVIIREELRAPNFDWGQKSHS
jgi:hypothetical protein